VEVVQCTYELGGGIVNFYYKLY